MLLERADVYVFHPQMFVEHLALVVAGSGTAIAFHFKNTRAMHVT